jgi:hypothetical protein
LLDKWQHTLFAEPGLKIKFEKCIFSDTLHTMKTLLKINLLSVSKTISDIMYVESFTTIKSVHNFTTYTI